MNRFNFILWKDNPMDLQRLIAALQAASHNNINVNITVTPAVSGEPDATTPELPDTDSQSSSCLPDTDFDIGDRVIICHTRHDGTTIHTAGEVIEVCQKDDKGYYTRVLGENGKHYRIGLHYDEVRLGSKAIVLD